MKYVLTVEGELLGKAATPIQNWYLGAFVVVVVSTLILLALFVF